MALCDLHLPFPADGRARHAGVHGRDESFSIPAPVAPDAAAGGVFHRLEHPVYPHGRVGGPCLCRAAPWPEGSAPALRRHAAPEFPLAGAVLRFGAPPGRPGDPSGHAGSGHWHGDPLSARQQTGRLAPAPLHPLALLRLLPEFDGLPAERIGRDGFSESPFARRGRLWYTLAIRTARRTRMAYDFTTLPDRWNAGAFK